MPYDAESSGRAVTYTGREFDQESGLYYYRARYFDPNTGRFLSEDPIGFAGGDANLYRYVVNNPLNLVDPNGRNPLVLVPLLGISVGDFFAGAGGAAALLGLLSTASDSSDAGARTPNNQDPEGALEGLQKKQDKLNKSKDPNQSIKDPGSEMEGMKRRPKQNKVRNKNKSEQRGKDNRNKNPQCE